MDTKKSRTCWEISSGYISKKSFLSYTEVATKFAKEKFNEHPLSVRLTYHDHFKGALTYSFKSGVASVVLLIHAVFPFMFEHTGGDIIAELNDTLNTLKSN